MESTPSGSISNGVAEGTILGSTLFTIFIDDLEEKYKTITDKSLQMRQKLGL